MPPLKTSLRSFYSGELSNKKISKNIEELTQNLSTMTFIKLRLFIVAILVLTLSSGCADCETKASSNFSDVQRLLTTKKCLGCRIGGADLTGADLTGADLEWADLSGAHLEKANLRGANLTGARLSYIKEDTGWGVGCDVRSVASLAGANLIKADLSEANLAHVNLSEANLMQANLSEANLEFADLSRAKLNQANLSEADLGYSVLTEADLRLANLKLAVIPRVLEKVDLRGTKLYLSNKWLVGANLKRANLEGVNLQDVNLREANLQGAERLF